MKTRAPIPLNTTRGMQIALVVGVVAAILAAAGLFISGPQAFFQAYLYSFVFWIGISLGCLALLSLNLLSGNHWGLTIRRINQAASGGIWLMAILFVPLLFALPIVFHWTRPDVVAGSAYIQAKTWYLNVPFFILRAVIYFLVWIGLGFLLNRAIALRTDAKATPLTGRPAGVGAVGFILWAFTMTYAATDWIVSLQPEWSSTIFGVAVMTAQVMTAMSFGILVLNLVPGLGLGRDWNYKTTPTPFADLGGLLVTFVLGWTYMAFFQGLIVWAGNIPREVVWYTNRIDGGWGFVMTFIAIFQFALPFILLLAFQMRRDLRHLVILAALLLFTNLVYIFWVVKPSFFPGQFAISWLDIVMPIAMGGLWVAVFLRNLARTPALTPAEQEMIEPTPEEQELAAE